MSIECMAAVINARRAPWRQGEFAVLLMLANYADPKGESIYPSVERLSRACRLSERQTQNCIRNLRADGVLREEKKPPHLRYLKTRLFSIDMARVAFFDGCKNCGGAICNDQGCNLQHAGVQLPTLHIDEPLRTVIDPSGASAPAPVDTPARSPVDSPARAPAIWDAVRLGLGNLRFAKHCSGGVPILKDGTLVVSFGTEAKAVRAQEVVNEMARAAGVPVRISLRAA